MKNLFSVFLLILLTSRITAQPNLAPPRIIPEPVKVATQKGYYLLSSATPLTINGFDKAPLSLGNFAREILLNQSSTNPPSFNFSNKADSGLVLQLNKSLKIHNEGYLLSVSKNGIKITANTEKGLFYGLQTLLQLIPEQECQQQKAIALVEIEDYPRYNYRGLHLDVGRHVFPISFIKTYIDLIAQYKLNTFHWHLTEDQGWRIEIKKYPRLTEIGGYRAQTLIGGHIRNKSPQFDSIPYGGFYTQDEIKQVVAYAASKYITVIPEIEMPGHSMAALAAYPHLACGDNPGPFKTAENFGIFEDVYCAGKEETFKFLQDVLDEVLVLFPSKYIHIGGDESPKAKWKTCTYCQNRIKKEKLKDEHELQSYFIQRMEKYLNKKGRQIIGWDETLEGGIAPNATIMSWRGTKGGIAAAMQNHDVIMTPSNFLYIDYHESKSIEEPLTIGKGPLTLERLYSYDPTPSELTEVQKKHILGVQANMWTEYVKTPNKLFYLLYPRLFGLSEIAWTQLENKNWKYFSENKIPFFLEKLDKQGINYRVPEPIGAKETTLKGNNFSIDYKIPVNGAQIYYTLDGKIPGLTDYLYEGPITIKVPASAERTIKSIVITPSGKRSVVTTTILTNTD